MTKSKLPITELMLTVIKRGENPYSLAIKPPIEAVKAAPSPTKVLYTPEDKPSCPLSM